MAIGHNVAICRSTIPNQDKHVRLDHKEDFLKIESLPLLGKQSAIWMWALPIWQFEQFSRHLQLHIRITLSRESVPSWNFQLNRGFLYFFPHSKLRIPCCWLSAVIHWSSPFVDFGSEYRHNKREQSHFRRSWWAAHRNSIKSALAISRVSFTNRQRSAIWVLSRIGVVSE